MSLILQIHLRILSFRKQKEKYNLIFKKKKNCNIRHSMKIIIFSCLLQVIY